MLTPLEQQKPTFLFVSKDEIDPLVDLAGDELRLECLPVDPDKLVRVRGPGWQLHVAHLRPVFNVAELEPVHVDKHLGEAEKLRDQFLNEEQEHFRECATESI
jgi:hypothetical protein